jgi:phage terminase large subunit-like protein
MRKKYDEWERQGFFTYTETNVTDYRRITEDILDFVRQYPTESVSYDPWNATQW